MSASETVERGLHHEGVSVKSLRALGNFIDAYHQGSASCVDTNELLPFDNFVSNNNDNLVLSDNAVTVASDGIYEVSFYLNGIWLNSFGEASVVINLYTNGGNNPQLSTKVSAYNRSISSSGTVTGGGDGIINSAVSVTSSTTNSPITLAGSSILHVTAGTAIGVMVISDNSIMLDHCGNIHLIVKQLV